MIGVHTVGFFLRGPRALCFWGLQYFDSFASFAYCTIVLFLILVSFSEIVKRIVIHIKDSYHSCFGMGRGARALCFWGLQYFDSFASFASCTIVTINNYSCAIQRYMVILENSQNIQQFERSWWKKR